MACPDSKNTIGKKKSEKLGIKIKNLLCGNPWEGDKKKYTDLGKLLANHIHKKALQSIKELSNFNS